MDWKLLTELRETFLSEKPAAKGDYWKSRSHLEAYDETFAARIGWKWDAVLRELKARGWRSKGSALVDWGCGTGIASRRFLTAFEPLPVYVHDRSRLAQAFAVSKIPGAKPLEGDPPTPFILLLSHVLNELTAPQTKALLALAGKAQSVLWVEPGTPELSRKLIDFRETARQEFHVVAPCPHEARCGLLSPENARHWCHHFAEPPPEVFTESHWAKFSRELRIDLRSLPVSFLVLDREPPAHPPTPARVIGRPRRYKGYATYLSCDETGVTEKKCLECADPERYRELEENKFTRFIRKN